MEVGFVRVVVLVLELDIVSAIWRVVFCFGKDKGTAIILGIRIGTCIGQCGRFLTTVVPLPVEFGFQFAPVDNLKG